MSTATTGAFDRSAYAAPEANLIDNAEQAEDKLFSAKGRVGIWRFNARIMQSFLAIGAAGALMFGAYASGSDVFMMVAAVPLLFVVIAAAVLMIYTTIKRIHDLGYSGWYYLLALIPIVGVFWSIYYTFKPGSEEQNKFGLTAEQTTADKVFGVMGMITIMAINIASLIPVITGA